MFDNISKKEADDLLNQLYDSTGADTSKMTVGSGPGWNAPGTISNRMRELRDSLLADGLIWKSRRNSIGITDTGIAQVESARKSQNLKWELDSPFPTSEEGIAAELDYWIRRQSDGEPGSNHWVQVQARIDHLRYLDGKDREMKSKAHEGASAPLPSAKAINILQEHITVAEVLRSEPFSYAGREEWTTTAKSILHRAFEAGNSIFRAFSASLTIVWNMNHSQEEKREIANENLDAQLSVLRSAIQQLSWGLPDSNESFHPAGSAHDAYVEIRALIQTAKTELMIVDAYVDGTLWALLTNVLSPVRVRVMTENPKPDFAHERKLFIAQHGVAVEARKTKSYHDRFIVIDNSSVWHMGTSLNHAGKKAFAFTEFIQPSIRKAVIADIESTWNAATPIAL
jgi:hypothetical protein